MAKRLVSMRANYGHTFQLYEENVHIPFLIAAAGLMSGQMRSAQVVSLVDTAPTIIDLVGLATPTNYQGHSMLDAEPRMAFFFADYSLGLVGLRDGNNKLIHELGSSRSKLYDLRTDPQEKRDLSQDNAEQVRWYAANLRNWSQSQKKLLQAGK
jgi:arylsulfatase A-like enzyme